jgi:hypothetical protein
MSDCRKHGLGGFLVGFLFYSCLGIAHVFSASTSLKYTKRSVVISTNTQKIVIVSRITLPGESPSLSKAPVVLSAENYIMQPTFMAGTHISTLNVVHKTELRYTRDGLSEITQSHPEFNLPPDLHFVDLHPLLELSDRPGHQVAFDLLRDNPPRSVTYIVLGPLTNLARMLRIDGTFVRERIGRVVIMGGAFDVPGNVTPSAECASLLFSPSRFPNDRCACPQSISSLTHSPSPRYSHPRIHACHLSACSYSLWTSLVPTSSLLLPIPHTSILPSLQTDRLFKRARRRSRTFLARSFDACATSCVRMARTE